MHKRAAVQYSYHVGYHGAMLQIKMIETSGIFDMTLTGQGEKSMGDLSDVNQSSCRNFRGSRSVGGAPRSTTVEVGILVDLGSWRFWISEYRSPNPDGYEDHDRLVLSCSPCGGHDELRAGVAVLPRTPSSDEPTLQLWAIKAIKTATQLVVTTIQKTRRLRLIRLWHSTSLFSQKSILFLITSSLSFNASAFILPVFIRFSKASIFCT